MNHAGPLHFKVPCVWVENPGAVHKVSRISRLSIQQEAEGIEAQTAGEWLHVIAHEELTDMAKPSVAYILVEGCVRLKAV